MRRTGSANPPLDSLSNRNSNQPAACGEAPSDALFRDDLTIEVRDYDGLMESVGTLQIARPQDDTSAWLLLRDRRWFQCAICYPRRGPLRVRGAAASFKGGMSGSPIVTDAGRAIGVVASGEDHDGDAQQPVLADHLPGWLLRDLGLTEAGGA